MLAERLDHCRSASRLAKLGAAQSTEQARKHMAGDGGKPNAGSPMGPDADSYVAMVARARALIPELRDRASKTEELRRLPPETERDLHDAGLFRIVQPKRVGGAELDYVALVDCADALGQARLVTISNGDTGAPETTTNNITSVIQTVLAAQLVSRGLVDVSPVAAAPLVPPTPTAAEAKLPSSIPTRETAKK